MAYCVIYDRLFHEINARSPCAYPKENKNEKRPQQLSAGAIED